MANKVTKKENFMRVIEVLESKGLTDLVEVMQHEIELIEKKAQNKTATKTQKENEGTKELILKELARIGRPVTITELIGESTEIAEVTGGSNQKVSALMTQLKKAELVVRTQDGKKALFSVAE